MSAEKKRAKAEDNDFLIVSGANGKRYPAIEEALLRKLTGIVEEIEQPAKGLKKKKEGAR